MKQVLVRRGQIAVEEVPAPLAEPGTVLVRVDHSCISAGTELSGIRASGNPLWRRAIRQPGKVKRLFDVATSDGIGAARNLVEGKLATGEATGYSAAGTVVQVGEGVTDLEVGDRVACAGAQAAHHAQVIRVPRNLTVPIPDGLGFAEASTVTLGAIALQGVRRAVPTLGETFVVIGLGILGQLTAQLLRANGCRVIGIDLDGGRVGLARQLGMDVGLGASADGEDIQQVASLTDGIGADGVIITASTPSDAVVSNAFRMCRKKGRVVLVGDVGLDLNRADFYEKELDFFISSSYGPGRYDRNYEERGLDYPVGYVRWTENRNMAEYLRLVADGRVAVEPLIGATYPVEDAAAAYARLGSADRPVIVLLSYPQDESAVGSRVVPNPTHRPGHAGALGVAVIGAGSFASGMHLPNIKGMPNELRLQAIVSRTGHNATAAATQYGAAYATTDFDRVLEDPGVDLVIMATRHNLHAALALRALEAGKHVLVEKPLALTRHELDELVAFYADGPAERPILLTGFNRRFSAYGRRVAELDTGSRESDGDHVPHECRATSRLTTGYTPRRAAVATSARRATSTTCSRT